MAYTAIQYLEKSPAACTDWLQEWLCWAVLSLSVVTDSLWPHGLQPARLLFPQGFSRQEYWSGLPCPPPGDLPNPGTEPRSPAWQVDSLPSEPPGIGYPGVGSLSCLQGIFLTQELNQWDTCIAGAMATPYERTPVFLCFPCGSAGKESACNAGDLGLIPG